MSGITIALVYRTLLRLLPAEFRARYATEMQQMFEQEWRAGGAADRFILAVRSLVDIAATAIVVRVSRARLSGLAGDARVAARGLARRPGFAATAICTIGLGIGAATAVFSVVDSTVANGLRLPNRSRVMSLWGTFEKFPGAEFRLSAAEFYDLRVDARSFERVGGWSLSDVLLEPRGDRPARTVRAALTVGDIYSVVGARTVIGRLPGPADDRMGAPPVAVISYALWQNEFGGDARIVGTRRVSQAMPMGMGDANQPATIVGVLSPETALPGQAVDVWIHRVLNPASWAANRSGHGLNVLALRRVGVSEAAAASEVAMLERVWAARYAGQHSFGLEGHDVHLALLSDRMLGTARRVGLLLSAAAAALLLLACANVANLLLARVETRASEIGVRIALGASMRRVAQPLVLEGLIISIVGSVLGITLAAIGLPALLRVAPAEMQNGVDTRLTFETIAFAVIATLVTGIVFTFVPAFTASRLSAAGLMRASGRGRSSTFRGLRLLVAGQTALAALLLVGASLFVRSLIAIDSIDPGLSARSRVALDVVLPVTRYPDAAAVIAFYDAAQRRLQSVVGVERAAFVRNLPLRDEQRSESLLRDGENDPRSAVGANIQTASAGVLEALGIPLLEGRDIASTDRAGSPNVALINQSGAQMLWPGERAVGKHVRAMFAPANYGAITIVGVYADVRSAGLTTGPTPEIILPVAQGRAWAPWIRNLTLVVQSSGASAPALAAVRNAIRELDAYVPLESPTTMDAVVRGASARERFLAVLLSVFGGLALIIAVVGVVGVVSFTVARQTRELAIRSALGGGSTSIVRHVLRSNAVVAGGGAVCGAAAAAAIAPTVASLLYGVAPRDAWTLAGVPALLIAAAALAALGPAIRVTRVPLMQALEEGD